jgi:hypothetical protein
MIRKRYYPDGTIQIFWVMLLVSCLIVFDTVPVVASTSAADSDIDNKLNSGNVTFFQDVQEQNLQSRASSPQQTGLSLNLQFDIGKAKYEDSDGNGFDDATILGYGLNAGWDFRGQWSLWFSLNDLTSYNALSVYPGYEKLDPSVTLDKNGTLSNRILDGGVSYRFKNMGMFNQLKVGIGWLDYNFKAKEHGYLETRNYQGMEFLLSLDKKLNDRLNVLGSFELAPMLTVDDAVKGDVNDPDRTANTSYSGNFWGTKWGLRIALSEKTWLESGFSYQLLHGEGKEHPDYRFLKHDYTNYGFYVLFGTRFFDTRISPEDEPVIQNSPTPTLIETQLQPQSEPSIQYP